MSNALSRIGKTLKTIGKFQLFGLLMWTLGGIYVAALLTIPKLLRLAQALL